MLRIYLTGELCLTMAGKLVRSSRLPGRQGRVVFAYLAAERARPASRDEIMESLWPQHLPAASDVAISAIISKLRAIFEEIGLSRKTLMVASGSYQLVLPADSWIDIEAALESVHLAEASLMAANSRAAYGPAVVACAILRRPFLVGEEGAWVDARREVLRRTRLRALDCVAQIHTATREYALAQRGQKKQSNSSPFGRPDTVA